MNLGVGIDGLFSCGRVFRLPGRRLDGYVCGCTVYGTVPSELNMTFGPFVKS